MYDEAFAEAGERRIDPDLQTALRRVPNILKQQLVASQRTLESKICESGFGPKPSPHTVYNAVRRLQLEGDDANDGRGPAPPVIVRLRGAAYPCDLFHLASADPDQLREALARKLPLEQIWRHLTSRVGRNSVGQIGEQIVRNAFEASPEFFVAPAWGNVQRVNGLDIPASAAGNVGSVDGLVQLTGLRPADGAAIIEVKNQREWIYPRDPALWDIIRNGFAVNAVPILFARKIYGTSFTFVLEQLGGLGIQMHAQFIPAAMQPELEPCREKTGLGFKDLNFTERVPQNLHSAIAILPAQIVKARRRMQEVRDIALPHLNALADPNHPRAEQRRHYHELQESLKQRLGDRHALPPQ